MTFDDTNDPDEDVDGADDGHGAMDEIVTFSSWVMPSEQIQRPDPEEDNEAIPEIRDQLMLEIEMCCPISCHRENVNNNNNKPTVSSSHSSSVQVSNNQQEQRVKWPAISKGELVP